jgi:hypothetical protein
MPEMWAVTEDTEGVTCDVSNPIARALCERPELRALSPKDLATILDISIGQAQTGILQLASKASGVRVVLRGVSFDEAIAEGGRSMGRKEIVYARNLPPDAGSISDTSSLSQNPFAIFALGFFAAFAFVMLMKPGEDEA